MADIVWPSGLRSPTSMQWGLRSNTLAYASPLVGTIQTVGMPGARWVAQMRWGNLARAEGDAILAVLIQLRGQANRLILWDLAHPRIRGAGGGSPAVAGAGQTGTTLAVDGVTPNVTGWIKAGDKFGVNGELKMATADANSDPSGDIIVTFEPPLRVSPGNTQQVVIDSPTAKFILTSNEIRYSVNRAGVISELEVNLVEAF